MLSHLLTDLPMSSADRLPQSGIMRGKRAACDAASHGTSFGSGQHVNVEIEWRPAATARSGSGQPSTGAAPCKHDDWQLEQEHGYSDQLIIALISDTHGVWDPAVAGHFKGAHVALHAGDVSHHDPAQAATLLAALRQAVPHVVAVAGNTDSGSSSSSGPTGKRARRRAPAAAAGQREAAAANADEDTCALQAISGQPDSPTRSILGQGCASAHQLPASALVRVAGWRILVTHIAGVPPKVAPEASDLIAQHQPHVVVCGHSHIPHHSIHQGVTYVNPGSAGPARFNLGRSVALLKLPPYTPGATPKVETIPLARKAPPRLQPEQCRQL